MFIHSFIWEMKGAGLTIRAIQERIADLPDPDENDARYGAFGTSCIHWSVPRMAIWRLCTPHKRFRASRFLNLDEEIDLVQWVNQQTAPPTIEALIF
jgi:hypothetical protein